MRTESLESHVDKPDGGHVISHNNHTNVPECTTGPRGADFQALT